MKSIGNDIVALRFINEERTHQPAFYSKFITAGEQQLQPAVMPFKAFVWLLWAVKESAYKYLKRSEANLIFSPIKLCVQNITGIDNDYSGEVCFQDQTLYFIAKIDAEYISAIVSDKQDLHHLRTKVQQINNTDSETQSAEVRRLALAELSTIWPDTDLQISKTDAGYPGIIKNGAQMDIPLSFAHHGKYVAYAFLLDENSDF